ncbi:non-functional NADPH-dependent codeinone reductase 2-like isoform X2 [Primulina huaijiensis]|uniref:non-functional NADPH-dependent codeinone reductase 2-like isoform X2 n=1 Tax=Primulina huaijiensis TaxID=1492673 RepID=UPI003CC7962C
MDANPIILAIPEINLNSGTGKIPVLGFGTASDPPVDSETTKRAVLEAIQVGYRHFDTASLYNSEKPLGEAVVEAVNRGLIKSREELFITSKLWCNDAHGQYVLPALMKTLKNLDTGYVDLYLIHWPVSAKPGKMEYPIKEDDFLPMDFATVWAAMEECQRTGLTKSIGVSNFSCRKLQEILDIAKIPPAVEVNPCWQQKKLREFCKDRGILVVAYSTLGSVGTFYGTERVLESEVLKQIAQAKGKTVAQVCLRWAYEQGIGLLVKSFNKERMEQNADILGWSLSSEEVDKISKIPQGKVCLGLDYRSVRGPYKTIEELWDGEI